MNDKTKWIDVESIEDWPIKWVEKCMNEATGVILRLPVPQKPPKVERTKKGKGSYRRRSKHP